MLCTFTPRSKSQTQLVNYKYVCGKSQSTLQREGTDTLKKKKVPLPWPKTECSPWSGPAAESTCTPPPYLLPQHAKHCCGPLHLPRAEPVTCKALPLSSWRPSLGRLLWLQTESINPHCSPSLPHAAHTLTAAHATMNCNYALPSVTLPRRCKALWREEVCGVQGRGWNRREGLYTGYSVFSLHRTKCLCYSITAIYQIIFKIRAKMIMCK